MAPRGPRESSIQYQCPNSCHGSRKNLRAQDLAKHSKIIKVIVHTQEVRVSGLGVPEAQWGLGGKFLLNVGKGEMVEWPLVSDAGRVTSHMAYPFPSSPYSNLFSFVLSFLSFFVLFCCCCCLLNYRKLGRVSRWSVKVTSVVFQPR